MANNEKLSKNEIQLFEALRNPEYTNFALLRAQLNGKDCACVIAMNGNKNDAILIQPIAIILTPNSELLNQLTLDAKPLEA
jgi:hypothetical protein